MPEGGVTFRAPLRPMCLCHDYFPLDPHLVDAAVKFEDLGYLQTFNSVVEINHSHPPPPFRRLGI